MHEIKLWLYDNGIDGRENGAYMLSLNSSNRYIFSHKGCFINLDGRYPANREYIYCHIPYPIRIESFIENPFIELDKHKDYTQVVIDN